MNRTALCIRMLQLLKARGKMRIEELARELETNPRNVRVFRKELETAGYLIHYSTGKYGGYQLIEDTLFPSLALSKKEEQALQEGRRYLESHADFRALPAFQSATDKILSSALHQTPHASVYLKERRLVSNSEKERCLIERCERAIQNNCCVRLTYRSLQAKQPYTILIQPYELLYFQGACYCLAYSLKAHDYRSFRFSEQRMYDFVVLKRTFERDPSFSVEKYVGKTGLIKGDFIQTRFLVRGERARLVAERSVGISSKMRWLDDATLQVDALIETEYELFDLLLRLGAQGELLTPLSLRERMKVLLTEMLRQYE